MAVANSICARGAINAVCYFRMSSDRQETSIPDQRKAVEKYAKQHGYKIIGEYADEGISGDATDKRKAFQKMIADAPRGKFNAIIVWDQDRFGRFDSVEAGFWIHPLRAAGVKLVTLNDGIVDWSDFTGRLMYNIKQEGKHQFLRDLARNTARGRHEAAKSGKWMAKAPYGYTKSGDRLALGPAVEVATVRRIFNEYASGQSLRSICRTLNIEGAKSPRGRDWKSSGLVSVLRNEAYVGDSVWNAQCKGKYVSIVAGELTTDVQRGMNDESDRIVFADHHPAIIDRQLFNEVQRRIPQRKTITTPHASGGKFLFTGLLRCGKCGGAMVGLNREHVRYNCSHAKHSATCDINTVFQNELADIVLDQLQERFLSGDTLDRLKRELRKLASDGQRGSDPAAIRRQLESIDGKLAKARRRLVEVDRDLLDVVQDQLRELRQEQKQLQESLVAAETPQNARKTAIDEKVDKAFAKLFRLHEAFAKADMPMRRELLQQTIDRIEVVSVRDDSTPRGFFRLASGMIHLRGDLLNNLSSSSECCERFDG